MTVWRPLYLPLIVAAACAVFTLTVPTTIAAQPSVAAMSAQRPSAEQLQVQIEIFKKEYNGLAEQVKQLEKKPAIRDQNQAIGNNRSSRA